MLLTQTFSAAAERRNLPLLSDMVEKLCARCGLVGVNHGPCAKNCMVEKWKQKYEHYCHKKLVRAMQDGTGCTVHHTIFRSALQKVHDSEAL